MSGEQDKRPLLRDKSPEEQTLLVLRIFGATRHYEQYLIATAHWRYPNMSTHNDDVDRAQMTDRASALRDRALAAFRRRWRFTPRSRDWPHAVREAPRFARHYRDEVRAHGAPRRCCRQLF